jgi:hypothetical protein
MIVRLHCSTDTILFSPELVGQGFGFRGKRLDLSWLDRATTGQKLMGAFWLYAR